MNARVRRQPSRRGFTLIELGIVIGVTAVLAAAIVPEIIETMRNGAAQKAAADVSVIHDSARLFFIQNPTAPRRWPGESAAGSCTLSSANFTVEMTGGGYLRSARPANASGWCRGQPNRPPPNDPLCNPWYQDYEVSVYAPLGAATPACLFAVSTFVPTSIANIFIEYLPQAMCGSGCPNPSGATTPAGFSRCCSFATKPGAAILPGCGTRTLVRNANGALSCP